MRKPIVGVIPLFDESKESIWMLPGYMDGVRAAGAIPVILPMNADKDELAQLDEDIDGYLFTGGHDVNPALFGEKRSEKCGEVCEVRDELEKIVYDNAWNEVKPVLGICRGIQLLNVLHGGTLYQDLPTEYEYKVVQAENVSNMHVVDHHMTAPYDRTVHNVSIEEGTPLHSLLGLDEMPVNSYHHQGVKALGSGLEVMARAEDGLVEGVYAPDRKFIWGVQWHPEFIYKKDETAQKTFEAFVKACTGSEIG